MLHRLNYWNRILNTYLFKKGSNLNFWHGEPEINLNFKNTQKFYYYMKFEYKANYDKELDRSGIPMLDYSGNIGKKYNPIAIAQYGLGNFNLYLDTGDVSRQNKVLLSADWLKTNIVENELGIHSWMHHFDFEYKQKLISPWYSGLAQGSGISLLLRAHQIDDRSGFLDCARLAFRSLETQIDHGGTLFIDNNGDYWIEEYIVDNPTHILNGFIWALFGVYDFWKFSENKNAKILFDKCIQTLVKNIDNYDVGYWSLYEQSETYLNMIASSFYHKLHIVQLEILYHLTDEKIFKNTSMKWREYMTAVNSKRALLNKILFKIFHY